MKNKTLRWLLAANILVLSVFGFNHVRNVIEERQKHQKLVASNVAAMAQVGAMTRAESTRVSDIGENIEHGGKISDEELDWCLHLFLSQQPNASVTSLKRTIIAMTLAQAIKTMNQAQKENLFQAMTTELAMDNPNDEMGGDLMRSAYIFGKLGDPRAIPLLEPHENDARPRVRLVVLKALKRLGRGGAA